MEITQQIAGAVVEMRASGRLDGYWADHLERALVDVVSAGHHHVRLDCSDIQFMSSAGIAVLMKFRKELARVDGTFLVVSPSKPVAATLAIARLTDLLVASASPAADAPAPAAAGPSVVRLAIEDTAFEVYELDAGGALTCRTIGDSALLAGGRFTDAHALGGGAAPPTFALGVGAFGDGFADCRARFGELLSVAGATVYQPADGTNVPDYLLAEGEVAAGVQLVQLLYGVAASGRFSHVVRFEAQAAGAPIALSRLLRGCLAIANAPAIGVAIVAETVGLVGAALRRSPAEGGDAVDAGDFFAHPGVRGRLAFTAEPAYTRGVTLAAGIAALSGGSTLSGASPSSSGGSALSGCSDELRPLGPGCAGHFHAAAFPFRAVKKGRIDLSETVASLFDSDQPLGVLHLLHDDRDAAGAGESEFVRGACWLAPIAGTW